LNNRYDPAGGKLLPGFPITIAKTAQKYIYCKMDPNWLL